MNATGRLHLIVGPVGAGKSTFARALSLREAAPFLDLDTWMVRLFGADPRPADNVLAWYFERRERVRALLWDTALDLLATGSNAVLEIGLVARVEREAFYEKARAAELELSVYCVDAPRDVRRKRVAARNVSDEKYVQVVPLEFFERASDAWEAPSEVERSTVLVVDV